MSVCSKKDTQETLHKFDTHLFWSPLGSLSLLDAAVAARLYDRRFRSHCGSLLLLRGGRPRCTLLTTLARLGRHGSRGRRRMMSIHCMMRHHHVRRRWRRRIFAVVAVWWRRHWPPRWHRHEHHVSRWRSRRTPSRIMVGRRSMPIGRRRTIRRRWTIARRGHFLM